MLFEHRFGIERIDMRNAAVHEQEDHALACGAKCEMRLAAPNADCWARAEKARAPNPVAACESMARREVGAGPQPGSLKIFDANSR